MQKGKCDRFPGNFIGTRGSSSHPLFLATASLKDFLTSAILSESTLIDISSAVMRCSLSKVKAFSVSSNAGSSVNTW